jgi:hypothetical protein
MTGGEGSSHQPLGGPMVEACAAARRDLEAGLEGSAP